VIIPVSFNFPNAGKLLALLFIPFAAWMSGSKLEFSEYPEFITTGIFSFFAKAQVSLPFLLDLFKIPHDMFNYYIPSSIINGKFDTMVSVMNLFAFSLIIASSLTHQKVYFNYKTVIKNSLIIMVTLAVTVLLTRSLALFIHNNHYNKDQLIMTMNMPTTTPKINSITYNKRRIEIDKPYIAEKLDNTLLQRIISRGTLRVGYRSDRMPFSYQNDQSELVGMDTEILHYLAEDLGVKLDFYPFKWENFKEQLTKGEIDIIPGVNYDTFNFINMELSQPYVKGQLSFLVKDYHRHKYNSRKKIHNLKKLKLAILGEPVFISKITKRIQALLPYILLEITPISHYQDFFDLSDNKIDALVESIEINKALTLLHPEYTAIKPKTLLLKFPMSYAVAKGEKDFATFLSQWLLAKKASGVIHQANQYWVSGIGSERKEPRWSIMHNILGWKK
jgi:ABC-type amino acid transport substrate-binding protein